MSQPVYRLYADSYLQGAGNGLPVCRVGGSDAGKPLWKNDFSMRLTRYGSPSAMPYGYFYLQRSDNLQWEWRLERLGEWRENDGLTPYAWGASKSVAVKVAPHAAPWATRYREDPSSQQFGGIYSTGKADGGVPVGTNAISLYANWGEVPDTFLPPLSDTRFSGYTVSGMLGVAGYSYFLVYPWWGENNATAAYCGVPTSPIDRGNLGNSPRVAYKADIGQPEGKWALCVLMNIGDCMTMGVYFSAVQHKVGWPFMPGRGSLSFSFDHVARDLAYYSDGTVETGYVDLSRRPDWPAYASSRDALYGALTFTLEKV